MKQDGNCIVQAVLDQLSMKTDEVVEKYSSIYLRRQVVNHACNNLDFLRNFLETNIRQLYGQGEEGVGPFSLASYLESIIEDKTWGDMIFLYLLASMWGVRISVVRSDNLTEIKYRHQGPLKEVCLGLLYNGKEEGGGHYSPLVRVDGQFLESTELFISDCYFDEEVDKEEREIRGEANTAVGDNILVARSRLIELIKKEKQLEEIQAVVRGQAQPGGRGGAREGRQTARMEARIRTDTEDEMEVGEVQVVEKGDHYCDLCKLDLIYTERLKTHVIKFHEGKFRFLCVPCSKGFMSKEGHRLHEKSHESGYTKCPVDGCKGGWSSKKAQKRHNKNFHQNVQEHKCEFCPEHKPFRTVWDLKQHLERCPGNTSTSKRQPVACDICKMGKYYNPKEIKQHKKLKHGW